jgi:cytochrome c biogenesis protein CcmG, thiol:disulfide interchange protein DsbE
MKIFVSLIISALALTGCAEAKPKVYTDGKVVNCNSIKHVNGTDVEVFCLGDGSVINIDSLRGPMILNVWGSWCAPCQAEIPYIREFYDKYNDKVQVVGLDVEEPNKEAARPFIESHGVIWPSLFDPDGRTRKLIGMGVPVTWFIDASGKVIYKKVGAFKDAKEIESLAKKHFNLQ